MHELSFSFKLDGGYYKVTELRSSDQDSSQWEGKNTRVGVAHGKVSPDGFMSRVNRYV